VRKLFKYSTLTKEQYFQSIAGIIAAEPFINHREVLATIIFRQIEPQKLASKAFQFKLNMQEGVSVSPIRIYKELPLTKSLDKQKIKGIFECLVDFVQIDKPVETEIPFLGLFKDFLLKLQSEKGLKHQTIIEAIETKFRTPIIQVKETVLGIMAEVFKHHYESVASDNRDQRSVRRRLH
jgi:hypothetical protein